MRLQLPQLFYSTGLDVTTEQRAKREQVQQYSGYPGIQVPNLAR